MVIGEGGGRDLGDLGHTQLHRFQKIPDRTNITPNQRGGLLVEDECTSRTHIKKRGERRVLWPHGQTRAHALFSRVLNFPTVGYDEVDTCLQSSVKEFCYD